MDLLLSTLIAAGGAALGALVTAIINSQRTKADVAQTNAETQKVEGQNRQAELVYLVSVVKELTERLVAVEETLKVAKNEYSEGMKQAAKFQVEAQTQYEKQVSELHKKIGSLAEQLDKANAQLEVANETIAGLREVVTDLRKQIADLLVKLTEK